MPGALPSHPAVVAREFGLPAVVGTSIATQRITTGDRVRVNGATGVVEILETWAIDEGPAPPVTGARQGH